MITKLLPALLLATQLHANIIELSQGTQIWQVPGYATSLHFFDQATVVPFIGVPNKGWVSLYGELDGGTLFDTDLFSLDPTTTANLWWDLDDSGFKLLFIAVGNGGVGDKIYHLGGQSRLDGSLNLNLFNNEVIHTIDLYGHIPGQLMPDNGATVTLLVLALIGLVLYDKKTTS